MWVWAHGSRVSFARRFVRRGIRRSWSISCSWSGGRWGFGRGWSWPGGMRCRQLEEISSVACAGAVCVSCGWSTRHRRRSLPRLRTVRCGGLSPEFLTVSRFRCDRTISETTRRLFRSWKLQAAWMWCNIREMDEPRFAGQWVSSRDVVETGDGVESL